MTKYLLIALSIIPIFGFVLTPLAQPATAAGIQDATSQLQKAGAEPYGVEAADEISLPKTIGKIINIALSVLGALFLILMIYGGFVWMTAEGDDTRVKKAQGIIRQAIIGVVIILAAYAITNFVMGRVYSATMPTAD